MSRFRISGSIFWGVVLCVVGSVILARNLGLVLPLGPLFLRYWPVLLIVWGAAKLVDYFRLDVDVRRAKPLFSAGDAAAIVLVILFGSAITFAAHLSPSLGSLFRVGEFDLWDVTGNAFTFSERHMLIARPASPIEITNRFGDVEITSSNDNRIVVDVRKTVRAEDQGSADRLSSGFIYSIMDDGSTYRIGSEQDRRFKVSLSVQVPKQSKVTVENRNGKVSIRGLSGDQHITNRFGPVEIHDIHGSVEVSNQNGKVTVDEVSDAVAIANSFAPIIVSNVGGALKINGRNTSIDANNIKKDVEVESAFQNIDLRNLQGAVHVTNRNGDISIHLGAKPSHDVSISSQFGNVSVELPGDSAFSAEIRNRVGRIYSDFPELRSTAVNIDKVMMGQVGTAGPFIKIDNRNGEIRLRKKG